MLAGCFDWLIYFFFPLIFWNPKNELPELLESYCWINWQRQNFSVFQQIEPFRLNLHNLEPTFSPFWAKNTGQFFAEVCRRCLALWKKQVFFVKKTFSKTFFFPRGKTSMGWCFKRQRVTGRARCCGCKRQTAGKKSQSGISSSVFNTISKAGIQGRSIEIPGGWD